MKKKIAVFTTGWCGEILSQFLTGLQKAFSDKPVDLFLFTCYPTFIDTAANKCGEMNIFNLPDLHDFDGTVIFGSGLNFQDRIDNIIQRSREAGIPVVMQGARSDGISYVGSDNYRATLDLTEHLQKEHNVHNIIFFAGTQDSLDSELRLKAVKDYLEQSGYPGDLKSVYYTKWENAAVTKKIDEMCANGETLPDAFICANDGLAMECVMSLNRNGYEVPDDVMVTGFDFIDDSLCSINSNLTLS